MKDLKVVNEDSGCRMKKLPGDICPHAMEGVLRFLGKSWNLMILGTIGNHKTLRYTEIQNKLGKISPKTLAARLKELVGIGLLERKMYGEIPPRVEYTLSEKGRELYDRLIPVIQWAEQYDH